MAVDKQFIFANLGFNMEPAGAFLACKARMD